MGKGGEGRVGGSAAEPRVLPKVLKLAGSSIRGLSVLAMMVRNAGATW